MGGQHRGSLVGEGNLQGMIYVRQQLDALDGTVRGDPEWRIDATVRFTQRLGVAWFAYAGQDHRRRFEIADRGSASQEFGAGNVVPTMTVAPAGSCFKQRNANAIRGARRHGGAHDDGV